jgi:hypothetical protein
VGQRKGKATLVFAGVNASPKDVEKGKNSHFRVFGIEPAGKGKGKGKSEAQKVVTNKFSEISRSTLFAGTEKDAYQRITRLSKPYPNQPQLGAVTTGLAKNSEIVLFDTSTLSPPKSRGGVLSNTEAVDVDFIQTGDNEYLFVYCNEHDVYVKTISSQTKEDEPECVYETPASKTNERPTIPTFRAVRWLSKDFLLMLTNIHSNGGVVLQILRLPPSGKGKCRLTQSERLPSRLSKATGLAVANLTPPLTPSSPQGYSQFVIAVAGHNRSISLFKADLQVSGSISIITPTKAFRTFKDVHPLQITSLAFSNFTPPKSPVTASTPPQYLKLASVGVSNTVVVHTIPLFPVPLSVARGQSETPRYVVALPSTSAVFGMRIVISILATLLGAIIVQSFLEVRVGAPVWLNARNRLPIIWQEAMGRPFEFPPGYNSLTAPGSAPTDYTSKSGSALRLPEFFEKLKAGGDSGLYLLKSDEGDIKAHPHEEKHGAPSGKQWEMLTPEQKEAWKKKFKDAGHWTEGYGETILKGVLFGEIAGAVGQAVAGG